MAATMAPNCFSKYFNKLSDNFTPLFYVLHVKIASRILKVWSFNEKAQKIGRRKWRLEGVLRWGLGENRKGIIQGLYGPSGVFVTQNAGSIPFCAPRIPTNWAQIGIYEINTWRMLTSVKLIFLNISWYIHSSLRIYPKLSSKWQ